MYDGTLRWTTATSRKNEWEQNWSPYQVCTHLIAITQIMIAQRDVLDFFLHIVKLTRTRMSLWLYPKRTRRRRQPFFWHSFAYGQSDDCPHRTLVLHTTIATVTGRFVLTPAIPALLPPNRFALAQSELAFDWGESTFGRLSWIDFFRGETTSTVCCGATVRNETDLNPNGRYSITIITFDFFVFQNLYSFIRSNLNLMIKMIILFRRIKKAIKEKAEILKTREKKSLSRMLERRGSLKDWLPAWNTLDGKK